MSSFFKKLSKIDKRTKYNVYGWVRSAEQELSLDNVPVMICNICILYIHDEDIFIKTNKYGMVTNGKRVTLADISTPCWMNAYGRNGIDSMSGIECQWDLDLNAGDYCVVGITSLDSKQMNKDDGTRTIWGWEDASHYLYYGKGASLYQNEVTEWRTYGEGFHGKQKVSIHLDLNKKEIGFSVNDRDQGVAYKDIKTGKDMKYRLVVTLTSSHEFVEIANFETK